MGQNHLVPIHARDISARVGTSDSVRMEVEPLKVAVTLPQPGMSDE